MSSHAGCPSSVPVNEQVAPTVTSEPRSSASRRPEARHPGSAARTAAQARAARRLVRRLGEVLADEPCVREDSVRTHLPVNPVQPHTATSYLRPPAAVATWRSTVCARRMEAAIGARLSRVF